MKKPPGREAQADQVGEGDIFGKEVDKDIRWEIFEVEDGGVQWACSHCFLENLRGQVSLRVFGLGQHGIYTFFGTTKRLRLGGMYGAILVISTHSRL